MEIRLRSAEAKRKTSESLKKFWELNRNNKVFMEERSRRISEAQIGSKKPWISKLLKGKVPKNKGLRTGFYRDCKQCSKAFYMDKSRPRLFCSRDCWLIFIHGSGWRELHPNSRWSNKTLVKQIGKCELCGFSDKRILMCHHRNGKSNERQNLMVLCPNCHLLAHIGDGWFKSRWNFIWSLWVGRSKTRKK